MEKPISIIIKCPECESDRIVSTDATTAADGVNYQKEFRCLNCGLRFDQPINVNGTKV